MLKIKDLKNHIDASDDSLQEIIDNEDLVTLETESDSAFEVEIIDGTIVNGVDVLKHPNAIQRERYTKIIQAGGKLAMLKNNGKNVTLFVKNSSGRVGTTPEHFESDRRKFVKMDIIRKVVNNQVEKGIIEKKGTNGRLRPKNMKIGDFWAQFNPNEVRVINDSSLDSVISFRDYVNGVSGTIKLNSSTLRNGLGACLSNGLITNETYEALIK